MESFKNYINEAKTPRWNIKTQAWENASASYQKAQEDILDELKEITQKNASMAVDSLPNRDFDISYGNKVIVKMDD